MPDSQRSRLPTRQFLLPFGELAMANPDKRLNTNVGGDFYVDASCIDCGTCRWMAPSVFNRKGEHSRVHQQPRTQTETQGALRALVACPVSSIGATQQHDVTSIAQSFPVPIASNVYHCGYHHRESFGATSYLIVRPGGNVLVDSPRFAAPLVKRIDALGGVALMFLTHRDDVADHEKFAQRFQCQRILHADDVTESTRNVEIQPAGQSPYPIDDELLMIPVAGHTRGSSCLLYDSQFLFTGDHLAWNLTTKRLYAFRSACWFDWSTQIESMRRLATHDFEHVLPGHSAPCHFDVPTMREKMRDCIAWMDR